MKRVRKLFQVLCVLTLVVSLTNCQHDDAINETQQAEALQKEFPFKSSVLSMQEVEVNTKLSNQMRSLATLQSSSSAESVYNETYNFTIATDAVKFVESTENDSHSYTFQISRENNTGSALENLVFSYNAITDDYEASLVTYHFTASQQQEFLLTQHVRTPHEITYESIAVNLSDVVGENALPCTHTYTVYHITPDTGDTFIYSTNGNVQNACQHDDEEGITQCDTYTVIEIDCPNGGTSSANDDGTQNPASPTGSTTGGGNTTPSNDNDDRVITSPILSPSQIISDCMNGNSFNPRLSQEMLIWLQENRSSSTAMSIYLKNVGCDESSQNFVEEAIEAMMANPNLTFEDYIRERVEDLLEDRPFGLIEVPCSELEKWQQLASHTAQPSVFNRVHAIDNQHTTYFTDYDIQTIENAKGHLVNMDYFPVEITSLPINPLTNVAYTPEELLRYFRLNINSFIDNSWAVFSPVVEDFGNFSIDDTDLWNSDDPLTALLTIAIPIDEGTVIVSDYSDSNFTVITLRTPWDGTHPVSGVRDFGFTQTNWGSYIFYTRAVDRMKNGLDYAIANSPIPNDVAFFGSDALWESFQEKFSTFVYENGGNVELTPKETYRPTWEKIKKVLRGEISIDELDCLQ
ncbi:hypothetical protein IMCC3317_24730 [Kordia antarctica]|uniref:Uncharacterized protein n=1 Tax=Kordia antarctica TaxID=1218801 RepID=A0A7L4ZKD7_9FLAO|nr:hypothetical protein [Kordia antarctica]QHI37095.1 hypothetical protein IMCC3317_24730 [Kordia antarctica]